MSEALSISCVKTTPKPFGVTVEWKWPNGSFCDSWLELQYLLNDGRLVTESIRWPVTEKLISGLNAGERLQVRLRPLHEDGSKPDWKLGDWVEGVSSTDASEILESIEHSIKAGWAITQPGEVFINDATIKGGICVNEGTVRYSSSMKLGVMADRFRIENPGVKSGPAMMAAGCLTVGSKAASVIEQETLSVVLANTLHTGPVGTVMDTAIQLAKAVKAAFSELEKEDATAN